MAADTKILALPNAVLRAKALPVEKVEFGSKKMSELIKKMSDILRATNDGIGIAAPQIGLSKRIFIASEEALAIDDGWDETDEKEKKIKKKQWKHFVFINPEVLKISSKKVTGSE